MSYEDWKKLDIIWWREDIPDWMQEQPMPDLIGYEGELLITTLNKHSLRYDCLPRTVKKD